MILLPINLSICFECSKEPFLLVSTTIFGLGETKTFIRHFCIDDNHMGQYQLLSVLAARLSPSNIDHSCNLPVEICGINYTEKYTNL